MELKGSKTEQNLQTAFAGESQARNKYTYFASVAKKAGFEQISAIFSGVADLKKVFEAARMRRMGGRETLLFVDEIHRFNRAQQDSFLPLA